MTRRRSSINANLSVDTVADIIGMSPSSVRNLIARGEIRAVKIGRAVRIPAPELEALGVYVPTSVKAAA